MNASFANPRRMTVGDYELDIRRAGDSRAPGIVMVHGLGVSHRYFVPLAEELANEYDVTVIDLPGYGLAPDPSHTLSLSELGEVVLEYVRQAYGRPVILMGHSMGCQIIAHAARQSPDECIGLVLISPTVNKWERRLRWQVWRLVQDVLQEPLRASLLVLGDYFRMGFGRYLRTTQFMLRDAIEKTAVDIVQPMLIIRGGRDPIVPRRWAEYLAGRIGGAAVQQVPGAAHLVHFSRARRVADACRQWATDHGLVS